MMIAGTGRGMLVHKKTGREGAEPTINVLLDALVRQNRAAIDVHLVGDGHVVAQDGDVLQSCPAAD